MGTMVRSGVALLGLLASTDRGRAQGPIVTLPSAVANSKPASPTASTTLFYSTTSSGTPSASRTQTLYDVYDIAPNSALWSGLSVRRPHSIGLQNPAFTATATITISQRPQPSASAVPTFAANHGPTPVVAFSGPISLPPRPVPASWPAVWEAPFVFTAPFAFAKIPGGSLVVDLQQSGSSAGTEWLVEATPVDRGTREDNVPPKVTCRFSNGKFNNVLWTTNPYVGGVWFTAYMGCAPNLAGYGALGTRGSGATWNGAPLPIDLAPFGSAGCWWGVSADYVVPLTTNASGAAWWYSINIPNLPALAGQSFYDQALFLDPPANAWGVVTTWSSKWTIGSNTGAPAATVYATGNSANAATGTLQKGFAASMQFN